MGNGSSVSKQKSHKPSPFQIEYHGEHEGSVNCMALSEDGTLLATGSDDTTIRLWSTATAYSSCSCVFKGHAKYITAVYIIENYLVSASADKTLKKWDLSTGDCLFTYEGHSGMVNRVICTEELIISSSYDATARCWMLDPVDIQDPKDACVRIMRGHTKGVYPLVFLPQEADTGLGGEEIDIPVDFIITGSGDCTAKSWAVDTGRCQRTFRGHTGPVHSLAVQVEMDGFFLYTGSTDGTIRSWDIPKGEQLKLFDGHTQPITALIVSTRFLYSGSADRTAKSWVIEFGDNARTFKGHKHSVSCLVLDDGILYTGCGDGLVRAFEAKTGVLRRVFRGHLYTVNCMKMVGGKMFTGSFDKSVRVWSLQAIKDSEDPYKFPKKTKIQIQESKSMMNSRVGSAVSVRSTYSDPAFTTQPFDTNNNEGVIK